MSHTSRAEDGVRYWESARFRERVRAFVADAVGEPAELTLVRNRPWSTVWRAETPTGTYFAKDNCAGQRHEATLLPRLASLAPDHVVAVTAADPSTGLLLTPDAGPTLRDVQPAGRPVDVETWAEVIAAAAQVQRAVAPVATTLGLQDLSPGGLPRTLAELLARIDALPGGDPRRLAAEDRRRLDGALPGVQRWCDDVAAVGLPVTINHNDLHTANVFADGLRCFDFGDAVLGDPFAVLLVPLLDAAREHGCDPFDRRLEPLAEAAVEAWSDLAPASRMRAVLPVSTRLSRVARAVSWWRCLETVSPEELVEYGEAPRRWLLQLVDDVSSEPGAGHRG